MLTSFTKWLITAVMPLVLLSTGIIFWGATNWKGKLCIASTGSLINLGLAFWYSWLDGRPRSFTDWLRQ